MENINENTSDPEDSIKMIGIGLEGQNFLYQTAKWSKLLSAIGFAGVCLLLLLAWASSGILAYIGTLYNGVDRIPSKALSVSYIFLAVLYFIPSLYLFQFSINAKKGITENSSSKLTSSFLRLKSFFKFWGVLMLIVIVFYAVLIAMVVAGGVSLVNNMQH